MANENKNPPGPSFRAGGRGMSMTMAIVVMVVVIVIVGGAGYAALSAVSASGTSTFKTCQPLTSPVCSTLSGTNDVVLTIPYAAGFGQAVASTVQGTSIPASIAVTNGEAVSSYQVYWGDGTNYSGAVPTTNHIYTEQGWFVISGGAMVGTVAHTGSKWLYPIEITPSFQTTSTGFFPTLATTFSNSTTALTQFGWISAGGTVSVSAKYTANSTTAGYVDKAPTLTMSPSTGPAATGLVSAPTKVSASYTFPNAGLYYITMVGAVTTPTSATIYQNYTWTVYVAPTGVPVGCGQCSSHPTTTDPHPGLLTWQEVVPAGMTTEDPSIAYDTISAEPIWNVYQTLVAYNGSSTASYVPELATCVPGNAGPDSCQAIYGNPLIVNNGTSNEQRYWTFPIDKAARFYDPTTKASWPVYPSDLLFSMMRSCGFADLPGVAVQPGWIQCQSLLNIGNVSWDSGTHFPYNNTPSNLLSAVLVNNSTFCPASVMAASNGCITYDAWAGGAPWSYFLELIVDPMGAAAEPCGWYTYEAAGVPGFAGTSAANGDGPCYLPGPTGSHYTTSDDPGYQAWVASLAPTYWDAFQLLSLNTPAIQPNVRYMMVGSGPYFIDEPIAHALGYTLEQNPAYAAPTGCAGQPNCEPLPGPSHYVKKVTVVYQSTDTVGIEQYKAGQTDFATIMPAETPQLLSLIQEGKVGAFAFATLIIGFWPFSLLFSPSALKAIDPNVVNIPSDFFNYVGLREFMVNAYPYNTVENTIWTTDGIEYGFNFGGAIPYAMGNYYPTNISWPTGDPVSSAAVNGSAGWWWAQLTNSKSPYYDPELSGPSAVCSVASPCQFPLIGEKGETDIDQAIQDYMPYVSSLSGGELQMNTFDLTFSQLVVYSLSSLPGTSPMPYYNLAWAPDYPDPTDYMLPLYYPDATYTMGDAVLEGTALNICTSSNPFAPTGMPAVSDSLQGLLFWAHQTYVPQACQGNAYQAMEYGFYTAAPMPQSPLRILYYNLVEHIANPLALYIYVNQGNDVVSYASWVNPTTINTNPCIGAGGDNTWYLANGNGMYTSS